MVTGSNTTQAVARSNTAQLMAQAATRMQELGSLQESPDPCKCHGGQGHCTGCDSRPLIQTHKRVGGLDGLNGHSGTPGTSVLHNGVDGLQGNVTIVVQKSDGSRQEYSSLYSLALTDFDVEDGNGDGIFEPGEDLFVRRITVRNSGMCECTVVVSLDTNRTICRRNAFSDAPHTTELS